MAVGTFLVSRPLLFGVASLRNCLIFSINVICKLLKMALYL